MDENENPFAAIPPDGDPSFFLFAVPFVKDGYGQWIQKEVGGVLETDAVLTQVSRALTGFHSKLWRNTHPLPWSTTPSLLAA